jgi:hypothetical protein
MVQDHRNNQDTSLAAQGRRATGATAIQRSAGPGPCGPVPGLPRPTATGYIEINGRRETISNPVTVKAHQGPVPALTAAVIYGSMVVGTVSTPRVLMQL